MQNIFLHLSGKLPDDVKQNMIQQLREYGNRVNRPKFLALVRKFEQHKGGHLTSSREKRFMNMARFAFRQCIGKLFSGQDMCTDMQFFLLACQFYSKKYISNLEAIVEKKAISPKLPTLILFIPAPWD